MNRKFDKEKGYFLGRDGFSALSVPEAYTETHQRNKSQNTESQQKTIKARYEEEECVKKLKKKVDELISAPRDVGRIAKRVEQFQVLLEELREMHEKENLEEESY
ncbi:hypothetical protein TSAR_004420 [Trichomalopsis sarcophagae]|uniref:Uncharacterized protein n=1 Tax=Trichomalopsis sarcophagae TaxID=543379 RepID=A0A232EV72_9HYME|nr:hypothetical protein TSAR_004420 [Trichomalopsis sarcophagae]